MRDAWFPRRLWTTVGNDSGLLWVRQADEMSTEKAFAVGKEVVRDDGTGKVHRTRVPLRSMCMMQRCKGVHGRNVRCGVCSVERGARSPSQGTRRPPRGRLWAVA